VLPFIVQFSTSLSSVHAHVFSKVFVFVVTENASIDWRPHYCFDAFSTVPTKPFEKDRTVIGILCACYQHILMGFRLSTLIRCVSTFDQNAQRISVAEGLSASKCIVTIRLQISLASKNANIYH